MRRPIIPCACLLALVTGVWFGQAYTLLAPSAPIEAADTTSRGAAAIAWRYYDALDLHFRTGDDDAVREIISTDFIDHVDTPGSLANRDGLLGYLAELRASYPTLHLVHHDVIAQNDRAVAQITVDSAAEGTIMGISLGGAPPWPEVEIVRIEADKIVERWGSPAGYALSTPLFAESMAVASRAVRWSLP